MGCDGWPPTPPKATINFNPRTPVGCDYGTRYQTAYSLLFQSTHPSGVRHDGEVVGRFHVHISIHAPQWGATCRVDWAGGSGRISIHAPQWGATSVCEPPSVWPSNFNPRTPVGCDNLSRRRLSSLEISIHAPQWGATNIKRRLDLGGAISIHAPQWGATLNWAMVRASFLNFNPRTPVGCDLAAAFLRVTRDISIHAPQWGATFTGWCAGNEQAISIHAPQWGATSGIISVVSSVFDFNPRTPVGCDRTHGNRFAESDISIHAPQWGATPKTRFWLTISKYFNPRTPVGCDACFLCSNARRLISIHAPQWGATSGPQGRRHVVGYFNPRTPVGCD